jgi:hypothetical protein
MGWGAELKRFGEKVRPDSSTEGARELSRSTIAAAVPACHMAEDLYT